MDAFGHRRALEQLWQNRYMPCQIECEGDGPATREDGQSRAAGCLLRKEFHVCVYFLGQCVNSSLTRIEPQSDT